MYDRDITMLQVVAAISDPNRFLIRVLDRFSLTRWATIGFEDMPMTRSIEATPSTPSATPEDLSRITVTLAEEMMHLIIILLMERYTPGVGQATTSDALKREALHVLCTGPKPFSYFERVISRTTYFRKEQLHDAVASVGNFRRPASTTTGFFSLKPECRDQYNSFFYHYQKAHISAGWLLNKESNNCPIISSRTMSTQRPSK
jgi:E3 ubiquitin-protein ligase UBR2